VPLEADAPETPRRVLMGGIGNIFMGDDGFGVAVSQRLARRPLPDGVDVVDFGIRGMDLAYAVIEPEINPACSSASRPTA
jgi:Ni,Fe-hydrogenase maturation factor